MQELALISAAALMGVAGLPHCAAMCAAPCTALTRGAGSQPLFQVARVAGYAAAGAVAAWSVGALRDGLAWSPALRPLWSLLHLAALACGLWMLWRGQWPAFLQRATAGGGHLGVAGRVAAHRRPCAQRGRRRVVDRVAVRAVAIGAAGGRARVHAAARRRGDGGVCAGVVTGVVAGAAGDAPRAGGARSRRGVGRSGSADACGRRADRAGLGLGAGPRAVDARRCLVRSSLVSPMHNRGRFSLSLEGTS